MLISEGSAVVGVLVNLESEACVFRRWTWVLISWRGGMGHDSVLYIVLIVLCGDVIKGSALPVTACVASCASILGTCGCVCICVDLWDTHFILLLAEPGNRKAAAVSVSLGQRALRGCYHPRTLNNLSYDGKLKSLSISESSLIFQYSLRTWFIRWKDNFEMLESAEICCSIIHRGAVYSGMMFSPQCICICAFQKMVGVLGFCGKVLVAWEL